jgi:uncharacterized membrane protein YhaH (DUF805 family)
MGFVEAIRSGFSNYVNFSGRAPRSEYWYWTLFLVLASIVTNIIDVVLFLGLHSPVSAIWTLATLLPGIAVSVRRLHDIDRTGWWLLIAFTGIGLVVLLVFDCMRGTIGPNRFGQDPLPGA